MLFIQLYKIIFVFIFCVFLYIIIYTLNIARAIKKKMHVNEIRDFIFENYYKQNGFSEEGSYFFLKRLQRKDLLLLPNKLKEKYLILVMLKNILNHF